MLVVFTRALHYADPDTTAPLAGIDALLALPTIEHRRMNDGEMMFYAPNKDGDIIGVDVWTTAQRNPSTVGDFRERLIKLRADHLGASWTVDIDCPSYLNKGRVARGSFGEWERAAFDVGGLVQTMLDAMLQRIHELRAVTPSLVDSFAGIKVQNHQIALAQQVVDGEYQHVLRCDYTPASFEDRQWTQEVIIPISRIPKGGQYSPAHCVLASLARFLAGHID